ncbi:MAG TPA: response regulator transcription factor [Cerasibacillus sp.]|uniref:response regulator transcription factor n=1 Tax=Cerasibacillus sp. TaxID=2498711 RepID=UPI002F40DC21
MKVLIVDDHILIRRGIRFLLEEMNDVEEILEADNGSDAIRLAIKHQPEIVLMDLSMPDGLDGFTAAKNILSSTEQTKVIVLTMHDEEAYVKKAIDCDVSGYLLKNSESNEIEQAIQAVRQGKYFYRTTIPEEQLKQLMKKKETRSVLTQREQEVIRLVSLGFTNIQIGEQLNISPRTVERHKANMMQKLDLKEQHELVQYALKNKYVDLI